MAKNKKKGVQRQKNADFKGGLDMYCRAIEKRQQLLTMQIAFDCFTMAMRDSGIGEERCHDICKLAEENYDQYADLWNGDNDAEKAYSIATIDRKLQQQCPNHFEPWEERYGDKLKIPMR